MCRLMCARKWSQDVVLALLFEAEQWRRPFRVDELPYSFSLKSQKVDELYPQYHHKTDKDGRSLRANQMGMLGLKRLYVVTTPER